MAVNDANSRKEHAGDGVSVAFAYPFIFFQRSDSTNELGVYLHDTVDLTTVKQVEITNYTVTGAGEDAGGTVTMGTAPDSDQTLIIIREVDFKQESEFTDFNRFPASTVEKGYDRVVMMVQQLKEEIDRAVIQDVSQTASLTLPVPDAGKTLIWNATEDGLENSTVNIDDFQTDVAQVAADAAAAAASATAAAASAAAAAASSAGLGGLAPTEQSTPDDTVNVSEGTFRHPITGVVVTTADNAASGVTFPVVTSDSRIDALVVNGAGTFSRVAGTQAASPTKPVIPYGQVGICYVTIDETSTVVVNTADIENIVPIITEFNAGLRSQNLDAQLKFSCDFNSLTLTDEVTSDTEVLSGPNWSSLTTDPVSDYLGAYIESDASNNIVTWNIASPETLVPSRGFSASVWIYVDDITQFASDEAFLLQDSGVTFLGITGSTTQIRANGTASANGTLVTFPDDLEDTWVLLTATIDAAGTMSLYANDRLLVTDTGIAAPTASSLDTVRWRSDSGGGFGMKRWDAMRVWNQVLSSIQVASNYNQAQGLIHGDL